MFEMVVFYFWGFVIRFSYQDFRVMINKYSQFVIKVIQKVEFSFFFYMLVFVVIKE